MASLTGNKIKDTYQSLLKTADNGQVTSVSKNITDGFGSGSGLYLKDTGVVLSGSVALSGIISASQANVLTYDTASGQIYYTASSAIGGGGLAVSNFTSSILEYYVDKRFSGGCGVTINSNKTISSTNAEYLSQLSMSRVGDPALPYPDPWSAGFAASASIAAGTIRNARVIVKTGNEYTYGSSTLAQNGDMTGSLTNITTPDVAVSQIDYNSRAFDLLSPMVEYHFEPGSSLYNINKSWTQELVVYTSSNWDIAPEFKITGQGKFVLVYGSAQGLVARYGLIHNPRAEVLIEADSLIQNRNGGWDLIGQRVDVNVNKWWSLPSTNLVVNNITSTYPYNSSFWNWPSQSLVYPSYSIGLPIVNVNIKDYKWGETIFRGIAPYESGISTNIVMGHPYGTTYNINIENLTTQASHTDGFFRLDPGSVDLSTMDYTMRNNNINLNMAYVSASRGNNNASQTWRGGHLFHMFFPNPGAWQNTLPFFYENCNWYVNINKMDSLGVGVGSNISPTNISNCSFKLHCDDYRNYATVYPLVGGGSQTCIQVVCNFSYSSSLAQLSSGSFRNNQFIYSGNYINYSTSSLVAYACANSFGTDATVGTSLILDNFNGYQVGIVNPALVGAIRAINWSSSWPQYVYSTGSLIILKNSTVYVSGSTPIFSNTITPAKIPTILLNNVSSNKDVSGSFNFDGSLNISSNIENIFY